MDYYKDHGFYRLITPDKSITSNNLIYYTATSRGLPRSFKSADKQAFLDFAAEEFQGFHRC